MAVTAGDDELGGGQGPGGVFCKTVSWDAAQSALCSRASLWCEVARTYQNGCPACCPRAHRPSRATSGASG